MLIALLLTLLHATDSCDFDANLSVVSCTDLDAFRLVNDSEIAGYTLLLQQCSPPAEAANSTAIETVELLCDGSLPPFALEHFSNLHNLQLTQCNLTTLQWQQFYVEGQTPHADFTTCPLDCNCRNEWIISTRNNVAFSVVPILPPSYKCSFLHCDWGNLQAPAYIECAPGDNVTLVVNISAATVEDFPERQYFSWLHKPEISHNFTEVISNTSMKLVIESVAEEHLGTIRAICWHCEHPLMVSVELRVRVPIRARLEERDDSIRMIISGWPISPVNLTIEGDDENQTHFLSEDDSVEFFHSLVVRPDKWHSLFHRKVFSIFTLACFTCPVDHPAGNYSFEVCSTTNCFRTHNHINHPGNHSHFYPPITNSASLFLPILVFLIFTFLLSMLIFRIRIMHDCCKKISFLRDKATLHHVISRRTSRVTEETLLRLEERSSLSSSDYSGQIIPFIELGTIQVHEKIGKGAFGEVYCGSWEKTGERTVAIKAIEADEDVEKEAAVLSRLEHPNIVRLYGMTRDGPRLLLVFERMNMGDLRSYLRARAPTSASYSQFPPALTENELKVIVRQIVTGLCYLSTQQIVHRDLAARNCLVSGESDLRCFLATQRPPITIKISDFGMSRRLYGQTDYYRMQNHCLLPVRWLPPEAISDHRFSTSSDVWEDIRRYHFDDRSMPLPSKKKSKAAVLPKKTALGVTMWEVFSYGELPFAELNNFEMVSYAMAGMRPPMPKSCPKPIYELMQRCWATDPDQRITPEELLLDPCLTPALTDFLCAVPV